MWKENMYCSSRTLIYLLLPWTNSVSSSTLVESSTSLMVTINRTTYNVNLLPLLLDKVGYDYLQFLRLLCSDFPKMLVLKSLRMIKGDWHSEDVNGAVDSCLLRIKLLFYHWRTRFSRCSLMETLLLRVSSWTSYMRISLQLLKILCMLTRLLRTSRRQCSITMKIAKDPPIM